MAPTTTITYTGGLFELKTVSEDEDGKQLERDVYNGYDQGEPVNVEAGQAIEVSEETATRLVEDFPEYFVVGESAPPDELAELRAQLENATRDALNEVAAALGIEAPGKLPNKQAVVDAILEKRAAAE